MEDFIVYGIVIVSIIISIVRNFTQESKKDATRDIGKKPSNIPTQPQSVPTPFSKPKPATVVKPQSVSNQSTAKEEYEQQAARKEYKQVETLEDPDFFDKYTQAVSKYSQSDIDRILKENASGEDNIYNDKSSEIKEHNYTEQAIDKENSNSQNNILETLFKTKDEQKKAVIYASIFDRKY